GTVVETHRALGHVALDAPAIVSGVLSVSAVHAEGRVRTAVRLAADGPAGSVTDTGLGGLHAAMAAGRLDAYRAGVVAEELEEAPPEVRATVVAALDRYLQSEDAAHLRRRCRRALARISPDLLAQRAQRARAESRLRRWVDEPGVDRWEGTFPSEEAAQAWAAIDALAHRYVAEQVCATIERARAKALTDLVAGNATIETVVTLTVPATLVPAPEPQPQLQSGPQPEPGPRQSGPQQSDTVVVVPGRVSPAVGQGDLVEVTGLCAGQPVLVSHQWLTTTVAEQRSTERTSLTTAPCHPVSGALLDPVTPGERTPVGAADHGDPVAVLRRMAAAFGADRYRPSPRLAQRVRARDRRCRFPGCTVAAVFCDLDHVRSWPTGPTTLANLICLCRRHHRVKQRPGWQVVLATDGITTWTDPTGRVRHTLPIDALHATVLPDANDRGFKSGTPRSGTIAADVTSRARTVVPDGPHSALEFLLEHLGATRPTRARGRPDPHGRHRVDVLAQARVQVLDPPDHHRPHRGSLPAARRRDPEPPPF
ncbi:MAG TPA: HNH endonuclease signature motif containing protein, partial [Ornithinibacter sp.]|nr:HNH endonuclease signature motif containing protein [Ornithinibacter sp.]